MPSIDDLIISTCIGCGYADVDCIRDMVFNHDGEILDYAKEFAEDIDVPLNFGCFVEGVKKYVLEQIEPKISELMHERLSTINIDDNYCAWGRCADYGEAEEREAAIFSEMCRDGVSDELIDQLINAEYPDLYTQRVYEEARDLILDNKDTFKQPMINNKSFSLDEIDSLDRLFHETVVDRDYNLKEALFIIINTENEETDEGLWEGLDWRETVSTIAAYSYGNDVWLNAEKLYNICKTRYEDLLDKLCSDQPLDNLEGLEELETKAIQRMWEELDERILRV